MAISVVVKEIDGELHGLSYRKGRGVTWVNEMRYVTSFWSEEIAQKWVDRNGGEVRDRDLVQKEMKF